MTAVLVSIALVLLALAVSWRFGLALETEVAVAALRAGVQLTIVGLVITLVFDHLGPAAMFVAVMFCAASFTSSRRLRDSARPFAYAAGAIGLGTACGLVPLLVSGGFELEPREVIPVAGILIGGAMAATSLTGRRMLDALGKELPAVEARLALGVAAKVALRPLVRDATRTGLIPVLDQTKSVGLVTLPGTFVGLVLGGADPSEAARLQLVVLLSLIGVEIVAAVCCALLVARGQTRPGERVVAPVSRPRK